MLPQPGTTELNFTSFIILLGVVQGFLLTITYLMQRTRKGTFTGLFFLVATLTITEIFLNRTGYMYRVIWLVDFSEPLQFLMAPLIYFVNRSIDPNDKIRNVWLHFLPFIVYFILFIPFYLAPVDFKQTSYYFIHHQVPWHTEHAYPLLQRLGYIRHYQLQICVLQITIYVVHNFQIFSRYFSDLKNKNNRLDQNEVKWWSLFNILLLLLILVTVAVKLSFDRDLGDHIIATYFTLIIYSGMIRELVKSVLPSKKPETVSAIKNGPNGNIDPRKAEILLKINKLILTQKIYTDNLISLAKIGKLTGEPPYLVSQVINEQMNMTFYDWIAFHRIEEAKRLLRDASTQIYTIEEIAGQVGYNSKSAFNKAFKKYTNNTPSEFRSQG